MSLVSAKCPNCGASIQVDNERNEAFCSYCGSKVAVQEAIGKVKIDNSEELANLYQVARRAKEQNNSENAAKYYDMILVKDPNSWEANFYVVYYQAMQCKIAEIASAAISIDNNVHPVLELVKSNVSTEEEQKQAIIEICMKLDDISSMLYNAAKSHYNGIDSSIKLDYVQEYATNVFSATQIQYTLGDAIIEIFGDEYGNQAAFAWENAVKLHSGFVKILNDKEGNKARINSYVEKIKQYNASYEAPAIDTSDTSACYVATAVYGSYDCPEVWTLRRFRDYTLDESWYGRAFIKTYYATSPTLVKWFGKTNWFQHLWRSVLDKFVASLKSKGYKDTPYEDKY